MFEDNQSAEEEGPHTILVADDEPINRSLIQRRLEREGYRVLTAQNGQEAVEKARASLPDLVILDVMMPVMDGLEACELIKEDLTTRDIPIIFLSARDETDIKVKGLTLGANDYISKPFKAEELLARVDVAIRLKREQRSRRNVP
jgi:DNA-binding response OmpR family regulator